MNRVHTPKWPRAREGESETIPSLPKGVAIKDSRGCGFDWGASEVNRPPVVESEVLGAFLQEGEAGHCRSPGHLGALGLRGALRSVISKWKASNTQPIFSAKKRRPYYPEGQKKTISRQLATLPDNLPMSTLHTAFERQEAEVKVQGRGQKMFPGDHT